MRSYGLEDTEIIIFINNEYALGVPPNLFNIDFVFILRDNYVSNRKDILTLCWYVSTFETFCQVMDQCTENYFVIINNNAKSNKLTDPILV